MDTEIDVVGKLLKLTIGNRRYCVGIRMEAIIIEVVVVVVVVVVEAGYDRRAAVNRLF